MNAHQVEAILSTLDDGLWITPRRVGFLAKLSEIYEEQGVLTADRAPALHRACADSDSCWEAARDRISTRAETSWAGDEDGSIFWPWVGEEYEHGGVCVIGLNINHRGDWWSINDEYAIAMEKLVELEEGRRASRDHSQFAYRTAASAMAVLTSLDGKNPIERPEPRDSAVALQRIARLQAVKCSPLGNRSNPTDEMCSNCPPRYLLRELEILAPRAVVALGREAWWAMQQVGQTVHRREGDQYQRATLDLRSDRSLDVFVLPHPQAFGSLWPRGQAALVADLLSQPLAAPG